MLQIRVYDDGKEALVIEFRTLLGRHCRPVPPVMILDMISTDEGKSVLKLMIILKRRILKQTC